MKKCLGVSGNSNIQMSMLSHSAGGGGGGGGGGQGILILTKDAFWPYDVCEGNRSFRTQVIKYLFGHFVPY